MGRTGFVVILLCGIRALSPGAPPPQENLHAQLFEEADSARARAHAANAEVFAPRNWNMAAGAYNDADVLFKGGEAVYEVKEKLRSALTYLRIAVQVCRQFTSTFGDVLAARADAQSSHAESYSAELWGNGETRLAAAGQQLEDGNLSAARKEAGDAQESYRAAELDAIKSTTLARARELLKRADIMDVKKTAPQTLLRAKTLYARAAAIIQENRYDNVEARRLAEDAAYEAAHAIYLHQYIQQLRRQDKGTEDLILASEEPLRRIAQALGLDVQFDAGWDQPLHQILQELHLNELRNAQLLDTIKLRAAQLAILKRRIDQLKSTLPIASGIDDDDLVKEAEDMQRLDAAIKKVSDLIPSSDGSVIRDGNNVILRLYGVTFGPGSTIETRSFQLLGKVQEAIKEFPGCQVSVEGHAEPNGNEIANQIATEARAETVAQYLKANLPPSIPILSHGYGSTHPVTASTTQEGKALNRRIDVVIVPEWAIVGK